jgi:competence protein ComFB
MSEELVLINKMENTIKYAMEELFKDKKHESFCECPRCKLDVLALSLNTLPSKYVVTTRGNAVVNAKLSSDQWRANVVMATYGAMKIVQSNPRH